MLSRDSSSRGDSTQLDNMMRASKSECGNNEPAVTAKPEKKLCFGGVGNYEGGCSWDKVVRLCVQYAFLLFL